MQRNNQIFEIRTYHPFKLILSFFFKLDNQFNTYVIIGNPHKNDTKTLTPDKISFMYFKLIR
jgi:D-alanyl-lipoteichoic acid acyltransferase DltB (MBOAT superfamily)